MEILAKALNSADYVESVTTNNGGSEDYEREKAPLVELYRQRYGQGRDLWTGDDLFANERNENMAKVTVFTGIESWWT